MITRVVLASSFVVLGLGLLYFGTRSPAGSPAPTVQAAPTAKAEAKHVAATPAPRTQDTFDGWSQAAQRDEIKPMFAFEPAGGRSGKGALVIAADRREGLD